MRLDPVEELLGDAVELRLGLADGFQRQRLAVGFIDETHGENRGWE